MHLSKDFITLQGLQHDLVLRLAFSLSLTGPTGHVSLSSRATFPALTIIHETYMQPATRFHAPEPNSNPSVLQYHLPRHDHHVFTSGPSQPHYSECERCRDTISGLPNAETRKYGPPKKYTQSNLVGKSIMIAKCLCAMPRGSNSIEHSFHWLKKLPRVERCVFSTALPEVPHSDLRSHRISPFSPTNVIQIIPF
jgi:hypothetical protein